MKVWFEGEAIDRKFPRERFLWIVVEPYRICWEADEQAGSLLVPRRFITDLASVPRPLWAVVPPWDNFIRDAAVCHDRAYETNEVSRAFADSLLYYGMLARGASQPHAYAVWTGVRLGGYWSYQSGKERQQKRLAKLAELENNVATPNHFP